jgi:hypothetical protein
LCIFSSAANLVSISLCHDIKDLIQEFYKLELIVVNNNERTNAANIENASSALNTMNTNSNNENPSSDEMSSGALPISSNTINSNMPKDSSQPIGITTPGAFFNHHASRFKSKLMTPTHLQSSATTTTIIPNAQQPATQQPTTITAASSAKLSNYKQQQQLLAYSSTWQSIRNNLIILANAAAIELYFLCVEDEPDAEKLCTKCSEKFFINLSLRDTVMQAPLISSCIQVLGRLAIKYPNLSKISIKHLSDFLTEPSPILLKQYKHIIEKLSAHKNGTSVVSSGNGTMATGARVQYSNTLGTSSLRYMDNSISAGNGPFQPHHAKTLSAGINTKLLNQVINSDGHHTLQLPSNSHGGFRSISRHQTLQYRAGGGIANIVSNSKSIPIFEFLRDSTIECLCQ